MSPLEDKLRAALRETAADIPAAPPPLDLGRSLGYGDRAHRDHAGRRWISWAAPLAAAAVVVAVIASVLVVTGHLSHRQASAPADYSGVPSYYVALTVPGTHPGPADGGATAAEVRATATGAVLARITVPRPYATFAGLTAAAGDRTFVIVAEGANDPAKATRGQPYFPSSRFFELRIVPGRSGGGVWVSLRALPAGLIPANSEVTDLALSPDGTTLAADIIGGTGGSQLFVFNLATGTRRAWSFKTCSHCQPSSGGLGFGGTNPDALSWTADGRHVAFVGPGTSTTNAGGGVTSVTPGPVRLLDVSAPGTSLLASSKVVLNWPHGAERVPGPAWRGAVITPDGRTVVFLEQLETYKPNGALETVRQLLAKASVATGRVTSVARNLRSVGQYQQILYTNAIGSTLVVYYFGLGYGTHVGILRGNQFTPIPWNPHIMTAAW